MSEEQHNGSLIGIVEDDRDLSRGLTSVLQAARYQAVAFESAEAFLNSPERVRVSLLVVDVRLPGMTGLQLQRHLRLEAPTLPIIGISGHASESLRKTMLEDGAVAFFSKPVRGSALLAELERILHSRDVDDLSGHRPGGQS